MTSKSQTFSPDQECRSRRREAPIVPSTGGQSDSEHRHFGTDDKRLPRRSFLKAAAAATATAFAIETSGATQAVSAKGGLIDVNVTLSRWPTRRLRGDTTAELVELLREQKVTQAWAASFDALLHKDIAAANARLSEECRRHGRGILVPMGSVNPKSPDWESDLRRCIEEHRMPGIRLYPNYHGYKLDDPQFTRLLRVASDRRLIVQLALMMEDERMMHPLWRVDSVDTSPLPGLLKEARYARLVLLNALGKLRAKPLLDQIAAGEVYVETSMLEGVGGIEKLLSQIPLSRLLFGSHTPFFYFESALLKLQESALNTDQIRGIRSENARRLLASYR